MSHNLDQYFTPEKILRDIKLFLQEIDIDTERPKIADFTVGEGALLEVACEIFPLATFVGNDIDREIVRSLKSRRESWLLYNRDINNLKLKKSERENFDIILANPPYSHPTQKLHEVNVSGKVYKASYVSKFIVKFMAALKKGGYMIIVVPNGFLHSQRDSPILRFLGSEFNILKIITYPATTFKNCNASTSLLILKKDQSDSKFSVIDGKNATYKIVRGWLPIHRTEEGGIDSVPVIHTTNLWEGIIGDLRSVPSSRGLYGPHLLVPRVGRPYKEKIVLHDFSGEALSDCVFGISGKHSKLERLRESMRESEMFFSIYSGTGAQYTTKCRLEEFVSALEWNNGICEEIDGTISIQSFNSSNVI